MLRWTAGCAKHCGIHGLPPVALDRLPDAERLEMCTESERTQPRRVGESRRDPANRTGIEVVLVVVREQDDVERRQRIEIDRRRHETTGTKPLQR